MAIDIKNLLTLMVQKDISDIHFKADSVPALRVRGAMILATNLQKMSAETIRTRPKKLHGVRFLRRRRLSPTLPTLETLGITSATKRGE